MEQTIAHFSGEDAPLSVGLVFDTSGSMGDKFRTSGEAALDFLKTMNAQDEAFLVEFSDQAQLASGFTSNMRRNRTEADGHPARRADSPAGCRANGAPGNEEGQESAQGDRDHLRRRRQQQQVFRQRDQDLVREADVQIYAMGVFEPSVILALARRRFPGRGCSRRSRSRPEGARSRRSPIPAICRASPHESASSCATNTFWRIHPRIKPRTGNTARSK